MSEELKPCPFCGSKKVEVGYLYARPYIICVRCHTQTPCYNNYSSAKEAWDRRAT
jgi:Lar family restriction alleviation protein